jgi:hypothetical protein
MIGSVVFTLTFVLGWLLGIGSNAPPVTGKAAQAQISLAPDIRVRP